MKEYNVKIEFKSNLDLEHLKKTIEKQLALYGDILYMDIEEEPDFVEDRGRKKKQWLYQNPDKTTKVNIKKEVQEEVANLDVRGNLCYIKK